MRNDTEIKTVRIREGMALQIAARFETSGGTPIVTVNVSSVNVYYFDLDSDTPHQSVFVDGPLDPATLYSDTLVYDDAANTLGDDGGRNFLYVLAPDVYRLSGGKMYRVEVVSFVGSSELTEPFNVIVAERFS